MKIAAWLPAAASLIGCAQQPAVRIVDLHYAETPYRIHAPADLARRPHLMPMVKLVLAIEPGIHESWDVYDRQEPPGTELEPVIPGPELECDDGQRHLHGMLYARPETRARLKHGDTVDSPLLIAVYFTGRPFVAGSADAKREGIEEMLSTEPMFGLGQYRNAKLSCRVRNPSIFPPLAFGSDRTRPFRLDFDPALKLLEDELESTRRARGAGG